MGWLGTVYGGWDIDVSLVPAGSWVLSAGVGEDISFDAEMIRRTGCRVLGIDPTPKARDFVASHPIEGYTFLHKALWIDDTHVRLYRNRREDYVSESVEATNQNVSKDHYEAEAISIPTLLKAYPDTSVLKMDIEGAEYDVIESLSGLSIPQVCVEFHHQYIVARSEEDTRRAKARILSWGYKVAKEQDHGVLFIKS